MPAAEQERRELEFVFPLDKARLILPDERMQSLSIIVQGPDFPKTPPMSEPMRMVLSNLEHLIYAGDWAQKLCDRRCDPSIGPTGSKDD